MAGVAAGARRLLDDLGADVRALVTNATHPPATH
jgi:hypothetical protein